MLVGPNNSGKSSILDAFRLLEAGLRYSRSKRPGIIDTSDGVFFGYEIPDSAFPFQLANAVTDYGDEDAKIEFEHENGAIACIRLSNNRSAKFYVDAGGRRFQTSKQFRDAFPVDLIVVPTLAPLESEELLIQPETVRRNRNTRLAARNFRNIWFLEPSETFEIFKQRVERAWDDVQLLAPELVRESQARVEMFFEEKRVTREIQWAGFGFQVWLQIHTHLIRGGENSILVLDEPDIYLHPDLQHRLYTDVKELFGQFFLATHAVEIINVADTSEILIVEPTHRAAKRVKKDADYDAMLSYIGSAENADFAKITKIRKVLFVEGKDGKFLRRFARRCGYETLAEEAKSPIFQLGGFSQWRRAQTTVWAFKNLLDVEVETLCLFDKDYRSDAEIKEFVANMKASGLECLILDRKEIENYFLHPTAITKAISSRLKAANKDDADLSVDGIVKAIELAASKYKTEVSAHISSNALRFSRENGSREDDSTIISRALEDFETRWNTFDGKISLAPGKEVLKKVFDFSQTKFGVSITPAMIQEHMGLNDLDPYLLAVLDKAEQFFGQNP